MAARRCSAAGGPTRQRVAVLVGRVAVGSAVGGLQDSASVPVECGPRRAGARRAGGRAIHRRRVRVLRSARTRRYPAVLLRCESRRLLQRRTDQLWTVATSAVRRNPGSPVAEVLRRFHAPHDAEARARRLLRIVARCRLQGSARRQLFVGVGNDETPCVELCRRVAQVAVVAANVP